MEIWRDIKGFEGLYEISNLGRVKSLARIVTTARGSRLRKERILKLSFDGKRYLNVKIYKNNKSKTIKVHQLVAITFLNHKPEGHSSVVDHIDNNPLNNELGNLQIISQRENSSKDTKGSSQYTGVCWDKSRKKWLSCITINGKLKYLGRFKDETKAAEAYQIALKNL